MCGIYSNYSYSSQVARRGQFPYQVAFQYGASEDRFAGALISTLHVLTLADRIKSKSSLNVYLGAHVFNDAAENGRIGMLVDTDNDVVFFPEYDSTLAPLDNLAIVFLPGPVEFTEFIKPIALPREIDNSESFDNEVVYVAGWGTKRPLYFVSQALNFINVTVIPFEECAKYSPVEDVQLCLDTSSGRLLCSGDDGAPIAAIRDGVPVLIGIANIPEHCNRIEPQVAIRISSYVDWIDDVINME